MPYFTRPGDDGAGVSFDRAVGSTASATLAREWALVLSKGGIEHRLETTAAEWTLVVSSTNAARAVGLLAAYEAEIRADASIESPPARGRGASGSEWSSLACLLGFFAMTGPGASRRSLWFERGAASPLGSSCTANRGGWSPP